MIFLFDNKKKRPTPDGPVIATFNKNYVIVNQLTSFFDITQAFDRFINEDVRNKITPLMGRLDHLVGFVCSKEVANEFMKTKMLGSFSNIYEDPPKVGIYRGLNVWSSKLLSETVGFAVVVNRVTKAETYFKFEVIK